MEDKIQEAYNKILKVNEMKIKFDSKITQKINKSLIKAKKSFWSVIAKEFKKSKVGNTDFWDEESFDEAALNMVNDWVYDNVVDEE